MENFEGKIDTNLLHTYLYVVYLDALNNKNQIVLGNQKNMLLTSLCLQPNFSNNLLLNLILTEIDIVNSGFVSSGNNFHK